LRQALPNACIVQHYGLTEASRTTFLRVHEEGEAALESVGRAEGRVRVRINERGRIEIQGPHVALAILDGDRVQRLGPEAWLETSDNGALVSGLLYFHGRADDLINCAGVKLSPEHLETRIRQELGIAGDFCIARCPDSLRGDGILVALTSDTVEQKTRIVDRLCALAEAQGVAACGALTVCCVDSLPRTATGKVQRQQLAGLAQKSLGQCCQQQANDFASRVQEVFGVKAFDETACFHDLGGDSLVHMEFSLWLERALGTVPADWESKPLAELVRLVADANPDPTQPTGTPKLPKGERNENPRDIAFWDLVREDYRTNDSNPLGQGFLMLLIHRFGNWRMGIEPKLLRAPLNIAYRVLNKASQVAFGMKLDYTVKVGRRVKLEHFGGMILGARQIGDDVRIRQNTTFGIRSTDDLNAKPTIGNGVDIGVGAVIVGNITIGDNSVIGANSVVYTNIPRDSVVSGVPGKVVGKNKKLNRSPLTTK
jgi:serine O-acetyltransferase